MGLLGFKVYKAKMFNDKGEFVKHIWFPIYAKNFQWKDKAYLIDIKNASYDDKKGLLWDTRYFYYNISNIMPLILNKNIDSKITPELINIMLKTEIAKKLNDTNKTGVFAFLSKPKNLLIIGIIIVVIYLLSTGKLQSLIGGGA